MICNKCYYNNDQGASFCVKCGEPLNNVAPNNTNQYNNQQNNINPNYSNGYNGVNVPTYNVANAIVALVISLCCCSNIIGVVFAILSLVEGSKVSQFVRFGDMVSANNSLDQAKKWVKYSWISIAIWAAVIAIIYVLYFVFIFFIAIMSEM